MDKTEELIKNTEAYRIVETEKKKGELSHAYLLISADEQNLKKYLKLFAKLIMCENDGACGECRPCRQIEKDKYFDARFYPRNKKSILVEDVDDILDNILLKPVEADKKLYILAGESNAQSQNKLLKSLEEPPEIAYFLLGESDLSRVLPTVRSRCKILSVPLFSDDEIQSVLEESCGDKEKLISAVSLCDGKLGLAETYYKESYFEDNIRLALDLLQNMKHSSQMLPYSVKLKRFRDVASLKEFAAIIASLLREVMKVLMGEEDTLLNSSRRDEIYALASDFTLGATIKIIEDISEMNKRLYYGANIQMCIDELLLHILEDKYKWQK